MYNCTIGLLSSIPAYLLTGRVYSSIGGGYEGVPIVYTDDKGSSRGPVHRQREAIQLQYNPLQQALARHLVLGPRQHVYISKW